MSLIAEIKYNNALISELDTVTKLKDSTNKNIDINSRLRQQGLSKDDKLALLELKENVLDEIKRLQEVRTVARNNVKDLYKEFSKCKAARVLKSQIPVHQKCYIESYRECDP